MKRRNALLALLLSGILSVTSFGMPSFAAENAGAQASEELYLSESEAQSESDQKADEQAYDAEEISQGAEGTSESTQESTEQTIDEQSESDATDNAQLVADAQSADMAATTAADTQSADMAATTATDAEAVTDAATEATAVATDEEKLTDVSTSAESVEDAEPDSAANASTTSVEIVLTESSDEDELDNTLEKRVQNGWLNVDGKSYWYENGVRQGTRDDAQGVMGDGVIRGREIFDPESNTWYWLDAEFDGAKATSKEVWMPYIYQHEDPVTSGKWVRYDSEGHMVTGWFQKDDGGLLYYDPVTGAMVKGDVTVEGKHYHFDENTGVLNGKGGVQNGWLHSGSREYWYENGVRQGTYNDKNGVRGDGTIRGREIYDPGTDAWYWLDAVLDGAKATDKEVWMPYIYQHENPATAGKWVRYDRVGAMIKGWYTNENGTYYYDQTTGAMTKGDATIDGTNYHFDETTGVLSSNAGTLSELTALQNRYLVGEGGSVFFTVKASNLLNSNVVLYCDQSKDPVATMHDDGVNGDATAGDGIYTAQISADYAAAGEYVYTAKAAPIESNPCSVFAFSQPTQADATKGQEIQNEVEEIAASFGANGTVTPGNERAAADAVEAYFNTMLGDEIYEVERADEKTVYATYAAGLTFAYTADTADKDVVGSDVSVSVRTYQPCTSMYEDDIASGDRDASLRQLLPHVDNAASTIDRSFNNYSFSTNLDNSDVTLSSIRNWPSNAVILWHGHGRGRGQKIFLITGEDFDWRAWWEDADYFGDCVDDRIINSKKRACVTGGYFSAYCGDLSNDLIYLAACRSGLTDGLAQPLLDKGATAVVGNTESILTVYNINMESATAENLCAMNSSTGNYNTLAEALSLAKQTYGEDDGTDDHATPIIFGGSDAENYRLADASDVVGSVSGKVCEAANHATAIQNATIKIYKGTGTSSRNLVQTLTSSASGNFGTQLTPGDYKCVISADNHISFTAYATVRQDSNTYLETYLMVQGSENEKGTVNGTVKNAKTGQVESGVTLKFRRGWNNKSVGSVYKTVTTGSNGNYSTQLNLGNYTAEATKEGYNIGYFNIVVMQGTTNEQNGTIEPIQAISDGEYVITLEWGENPRDMDSHMQGTKLNSNTFHVYYGHKSEKDGNLTVCKLDTDDTTSYGPEHITLTPTNTNPYYYYVYKYAGSGTTGSSESKITLMKGNQVLGVFNVPTDQGNGRFWNVFAIKDGQLIIRNTVTDQVELNYAD